MFTHMSRGMESIPAVFVSGSTVSRINVSVQKGQSPLSGSPPRSPTNRMLMRLPPSHFGYSTLGMGGSGVAVSIVKTAVSSAVTKIGPSGEVICALAQLADGIPGKDVSRQHAVKSRVK